MLLKTQAATEIAQFLACHPTSEQIIPSLHSPEVAERAYELIYTSPDGELPEEERKELDSYLVIEYVMELIKLEAHRQLRQQASQHPCSYTPPRTIVTDRWQTSTINLTT